MRPITFGWINFVTSFNFWMVFRVSPVNNSKNKYDKKDHSSFEHAKSETFQVPNYFLQRYDWQFMRTWEVHEVVSCIQCWAIKIWTTCHLSDWKKVILQSWLLVQLPGSKASLDYIKSFFLGGLLLRRNGPSILGNIRPISCEHLFLASQYQ